MVEIEGISFLIPDGYFKSRVRSEHLVLPELALHASLPDIGSDGASVALQPGFGDRLSIGLYPPDFYTDMDKELLYLPVALMPLHSEVAFENTLLARASRNQTDIDVLALARKFIRENISHDGELQEISTFFFNFPPEQESQRRYVVFWEGRLIVFMRCDKPAPETYPSCWADTQLPDYPFAVGVVFGASYRDQVFEIVQRVYRKFDEFNADAIGQLGGGPIFRRGDING